MFNKSPKNLAKLGHYLKDTRSDLGLSLRKAAGLAEISPAHLCKIEQGDNFSSIGLNVLLKLSQVYKIPVVTILRRGELIDK